MGSCVSSHKDQESAMKLPVSKTDDLLISSPVKEKPIVNGDPVAAYDALKSKPVSTFRDLGNKEETFFDSQPWLDSDCEDDFFSVNGDFTPSWGSSPRNSFCTVTPQANIPLFGENTPSSKLETSPGEKKKRLSDLFSESLRSDSNTEDNNAADNQNAEAVEMEPKGTTLEFPRPSANGTPYVSGATSVCSSERTPNGGFETMEKSIKPVQCCLPRLRSSRSSNERKKTMNPIPSIG